MHRRQFLVTTAAVGLIPAAALARPAKSTCESEDYWVVSSACYGPGTYIVEGVEIVDGRYVRFRREIALSRKPVTLPAQTRITRQYPKTSKPAHGEITICFDDLRRFT